MHHIRPRTNPEQSEAYLAALSAIVPTGYNSVGRQRERGLVFAKAVGSRLTDLDGNEYVDLVMGLGPILLGHSQPDITAAAQKQLTLAATTAAESPETLRLVELLREWIPSAERMVFTNTGSEAVQFALRLARAVTGKKRVLKFEGHFHGWLDPTYCNIAGMPPGADLGPELNRVPATPGQLDPEHLLLVGRWNNLEQVSAIVEKYADDLAAVVMEPIPFNFGAFLAQDGYLQGVRDLCTSAGVMLIFDEVVSGFRVDRGGAQRLLAVTPDISIFAKAMGGGLPIAMVAGSEAAMAPLTERRLAHAGTYNANSVSIAAACATTEIIRRNPDLYTQLDSTGSNLHGVLTEVARSHGAPLTVNRVGSVLQLFWGIEGDGRSFTSCSTSDRVMISRLCEAVAEHGVFAHPRGLLFLSTSHSETDVDQIGSAFESAVRSLS